MSKPRARTRTGRTPAARACPRGRKRLSPPAWSCAVIGWLRATRKCPSGVRHLRPRSAPPTALIINGVLHRPRRSPSRVYNLSLSDRRPPLCFGKVGRSEVTGQVPGTPGLVLDPSPE